MIFQGRFLMLKKLEGEKPEGNKDLADVGKREAIDGLEGAVELIFDNQQAQVNVLNQSAMQELERALTALKNDDSIKGLLVTSAKQQFILGADITEFTELFGHSEAEIAASFGAQQALFNGFEDLPFPTVVAINGQALGGGLETCLAMDYRVMAESAKVGLPEVNLGIIPGWGGTVRLPRLAGIETSLQWLTSGKHQGASTALQAQAVDQVVADDQLRAACLQLLSDCVQGDKDYLAHRQTKLQPMSVTDADALFGAAREQALAKVGPHVPAPVAAIELLQESHCLGREEAGKLESACFAKLAKTDACASLVGLFLNTQALKKNAKAAAKNAKPVKQAAVIGAGIMGGGIAYQSAVKGISVVMKDIAENALTLGMDEARKQLNKLVSRGRLDEATAAQVVGAITPTLEMADIEDADIVVEAVVENPKVKLAVLAELEQTVADDCVLTSNTSTISIDHLATALESPERFCGMHFFNPVPVMQLVEVIRGKQTSESTVSTVVAYAAAIGKTPIVVNDCPGFFVNRILFPYFLGFNLLVRDGVDFRRIDDVMERFGWPMGPAYLLDVVGMDTCHHCIDVLAQGFPNRMALEQTSIIDVLYGAECYGQKNGEGFYRYEPDAKGKPKKLPSDNIDARVAEVQQRSVELSDEQIVARMMIPLCLEAVRCLEEGVVGSAVEADMAQVLGIGFPTFRGGALRYMDAQGLDNFVALADQFGELGELYRATDGLREMAAKGETFF